MTKKKGLGKGLAALIGEAEDPNLSKSEIKEINESKSNEIPIEFLFPNKNQPRKTFDQEKINAVHIDQAAYPPNSPIKPNRRLIVSLATVVGLLSGIFLAFFTEFVQNQRKKHQSNSPP